MFAGALDAPASRREAFQNRTHKAHDVWQCLKVATEGTFVAKHDRNASERLDLLAALVVLPTTLGAAHQCLPHESSLLNTSWFVVPPPRRSVQLCSDLDGEEMVNCGVDLVVQIESWHRFSKQHLQVSLRDLCLPGLQDRIFLPPANLPSDRPKILIHPFIHRLKTTKRDLLVALVVRTSCSRASRCEHNDSTPAGDAQRRSVVRRAAESTRCAAALFREERRCDLIVDHLADPTFSVVGRWRENPLASRRSLRRAPLSVALGWSACSHSSERASTSRQEGDPPCAWMAECQTHVGLSSRHRLYPLISSLPAGCSIAQLAYSTFLTNLN